MKWVCSKEEHEYMQERQRQNRANCLHSAAEAWMADLLKGTGVKWTRQARWGYRLFDFWSDHLGVAVEVDGPEHNAAYDAARDEYNALRSSIIVLRVPNFDEPAAQAAIGRIATIEPWEVRRQRNGDGKQRVLAAGKKLAHSGRRSA